MSSNKKKKENNTKQNPFDEPINNTGTVQYDTDMGYEVEDEEIYLGPLGVKDKFRAESLINRITEDLEELKQILEIN